MENYYQLLHISKQAKQDEIKKAYLTQMKTFHPDIYKGDEKLAQQKTAELNVAYQTLKDENLRREYNLKTFGEDNTLSTQENKVEASSVFGELAKRIKHNIFKNDEENKYLKKQKKLDKRQLKLDKKFKKQFNNLKDIIEKNSADLSHYGDYQNSNRVSDVRPNTDEQIKKEKRRLSIMIYIIIGLLGVFFVCVAVL